MHRRLHISPWWTAKTTKMWPFTLGGCFKLGQHSERTDGEHFRLIIQHNSIYTLKTLQWAIKPHLNRHGFLHHTNGIVTTKLQNMGSQTLQTNLLMAAIGNPNSSREKQPLIPHDNGEHSAHWLPQRTGIAPWAETRWWLCVCVCV